MDKSAELKHSKPLKDSLWSDFEEVSSINDRRRNDFRPTKPMLESWSNYCNALLVNPEYSNLLSLAQTLILTREFEAKSSKNNM